MHHLVEKIITLMLVVSLIGMVQLSVAADENPQDDIQQQVIAQTMNNDRLQAIIQRIDPEFTGTVGHWQIKVNNIGIRIITDARADRMRIIIPIRKADGLSPEEMYRILQANFDSALDARYAIGKGVLWSTFIHPLSSLNDENFLSGLGQTINIVRSYGKSYSSGALTFGGGDSNELLQKKLIDELMKKGQII
ncbi:MAG: hypothetical protein O6928_11230 [Gammaproteobacteria bacterium]|nr:hypothetical protein [Gammaproteobacteria bacterium]